MSTYTTSHRVASTPAPVPMSPSSITYVASTDEDDLFMNLEERLFNELHAPPAMVHPSLPRHPIPIEMSKDHYTRSNTSLPPFNSQTSSFQSSYSGTVHLAHLAILPQIQQAILLNTPESAPKVFPLREDEEADVEMTPFSPSDMDHMKGWSARIHRQIDMEIPDGEVELRVDTQAESTPAVRSVNLSEDGEMTPASPELITPHLPSFHPFHPAARENFRFASDPMVTDANMNYEYPRDVKEGLVRGTFGQIGSLTDLVKRTGNVAREARMRRM
ncbi:hypothetical protein CI109_103640 [Kwoniella shandongensis]|uniref:Uncharacterized protein n=1 Tax=Kwoniella shandongensis TaxID=1734106 RepID=A0A5M6C7J7_9TREE|nr:uncharacterized protein CI109_000668 [Kwoniella shandongensis]KAA5531096.1 hypothetical protein CI109_000668 [Kwoniella shandongensis]